MKKGLSGNFNINLFWVIILPILFIGAVNLKINYIPHSICIFKLLTGKECWGCGMTHALYALFHFRFQEAFNCNPRIIIVAPLLIYSWVQALITAFKNNKVFTQSELVDR